MTLLLLYYFLFIYGSLFIAFIFFSFMDSFMNAIARIFFGPRPRKFLGK